MIANAHQNYENFHHRFEAMRAYLRIKHKDNAAELAKIDSAHVDQLKQNLEQSVQQIQRIQSHQEIVVQLEQQEAQLTASGPFIFGMTRAVTANCATDEFSLLGEVLLFAPLDIFFLPLEFLADLFWEGGLMLFGR